MFAVLACVRARVCLCVSQRRQSLTDFAPAQITATGVRPSSVRSALISIVTSPPLCKSRHMYTHTHAVL